MRIAYVAAGAAGMYCGTCIHDNTLAAALLRKGHQVALIPTYTPLRTDETDVSVPKIFYGGINVYLQQKLPLFRHTPEQIDRVFNSRFLLDGLSRFSSSTNARDLGALTVSILQGEEGNQQKELDKLIAWLKDFSPDVVHLTNSMFAGFARKIKSEVRVPVLCGLQGEDIFLDDLAEPYRTRVFELLRSRAQDIDAFIAPCEYYKNHMLQYLQTSAGKIHVVQLGLNLDGFEEARRDENSTRFTIGFLARICPEKGLHLLVQAFYELSKRSPAIHLRVAGYLGKRDQEYARQCFDKINQWNLSDRFEYLGEVDRPAKIKFLAGLDVFSAPTVYRESKGLSVLEAMACGVPVVEPAHGVFPEMIQETGGGMLCEPNSVPSLAEALYRLYEDANLRRQLGASGKQAVFTHRSDDRMADETLKLYQRYKTI